MRMGEVDGPQAHKKKKEQPTGKIGHRFYLNGLQYK